MNKILKKYFRNSERVVHCSKEFIVQKERKINFESNNHMFNVKLRDLNAHLLDQKMLFETTQTYYTSKLTSCIIILMFNLL